MPDSQNPIRPRLTWRQREARQIRVAMLDPGLVPLGSASPTVYEANVLLAAPLPEAVAEPPVAGKAGADARTASAPTVTAASRLADLGKVALKLGWTVDDTELEDPEIASAPAGDAAAKRSAGAAAPRRLDGEARTRRIRIELAPGARPDAPQVPPDAWRLLVEARKAGIEGLGLNHLLSTDSLGSNPFTGNPFTGNPFTGNPFTGNPFTGNPFTGNPAGMAGYAFPGFGGRQPIAFVGPDLPKPKLAKGERPVVAILDTGCGTHPWLTDAVIDAVKEYRGAIGVVDPATDPDAYPSTGSPLDGVVDSAAGHGTFIAGIVRQACPEARILPVRVADGQGLIRESDLIGALGRLVSIVKAGHRIDVVNLSFSYYHESPKEESKDSELYALLKQLRERGTVIVCSAGNDATDRPASPASLHHWTQADGSPAPDCGIAPEGDIAPLVTVGALNPSRTSVALFSNVGDWVQTYVRGVSVLSTIPTNFEGGIQADLSSAEYARRRQTLDVDDFGSGFAVWSGTSFAAPLIAGRIAQALLTPAPGTGDATTGTSTAPVSPQTATTTTASPRPGVPSAVAAAKAVVEKANGDDKSHLSKPGEDDAPTE